MKQSFERFLTPVRFDVVGRCVAKMLLGGSDLRRNSACHTYFVPLRDVASDLEPEGGGGVFHCGEAVHLAKQ